MSANGQLAGGELAPIGAGYFLRRDAAGAFNAMSADAQRRYGRPVRVIAGYRTLARQWYFWRLFQAGQGNLAAYPGTSNHGWGLAVDLASQSDRWLVDQIGGRYGYSKRCSDAASEWWHVMYNPRCTGATWHGSSGPRVLRYGMRGNDVRTLQIWLVRSGCLRKAKPGKPREIDGVFGRHTHGAVVLFQRQHHLAPDGVAGTQTLSLLRKLFAAPWPR